MKTTPAIHSKQIYAQEYIGIFEADTGDAWFITMITLDTGEKYLIAGGACNVGSIPQYAMSFDSEFDEIDCALREFCADLESIDAPSGNLLAWRGSLVV